MSLTTAGAITMLVGLLLLVVGFGTSADKVQKLKAQGPFPTHVTISYIDRTGQGYTVGPIKWQDLPNLDGPTDDTYVVQELLKCAGTSLGPVVPPVEQKSEQK